MAKLDSLALAMEAGFAALRRKTGTFSEVPPTAALEFAAEAGLHQGGRTPLPASFADFGTVAAVPFTWPAGTTAPLQSPTLRPLLQAWACTGATPAVDVCFEHPNPQTKAPLVAELETARYTGVPDLVSLRRGLEEDTVARLAIWTNSTASWDWKRPSVFADERAKVAAHAVLLASAFADLSPDATSIPVFFTDMATGVRCWIMVAGVIYTFHSDEVDLTLEQGIQLFRYFIANDGRLLPGDTPAPAAAESAAVGGAGTGAVVDEGSDSASQDSREGSPSSQRESQDDGCTSSSWDAEAEAELALYQYQRAVAAAAVRLQRWGVDLTDVYEL